MAQTNSLKTIALMTASLAFSLILAGCESTHNHTDRNAVQATQTALTTVDNHVAALKEVPGNYSGVLPCADCSGIRTTFYLTPKGEYTRWDIYETNKADNKHFKETGRWSYKDGVVVVTPDNGIPYLLRAEKDSIRMLDGDGNAVEGEMAEFYVLKRVHM